MTASEVTVRSVESVGPDTIALELTTPEGFDPLPGQFVLLRATVEGEELARHYTLSSPSVDETFELTVGVDPDGDLSPWLAELDGGETLGVEGPFGTITYEGNEHVVAIAGGPGVGPAVAIAEAARAAGRGAAVVYQDDAPAHVDRLEALEADGVSVEIVATDDDEALERAIADVIGDGQCYVFGFRDFVDAVRAAIEGSGGEPEDALIENFG